MRTPPQAICSLTNNLLRAASILALALLTQASQAANYTYTFPSSGTDQWSAGTNWSGGTAPVSAADTGLTFNGTQAVGTTATSNNDIGGNFLLNSLMFVGSGSSNGTAPAFTITGNTLEFTGASATLTTSPTGTSTRPTITVGNNLLLSTDLKISNGSASNTLTLSGTISGNGALNKTSGTGGVNITGTNNSFSGAVAISAAGSLTAVSIGNTGSNSSLGTNASITLGGGSNSGQLNWTGTSETTDKIFSMGGTTGAATISASTANQTLTISQNLVISGNGTKALTLGGSGNIAFNGIIPNGTSPNTSVISLTKSGTGTAILGGLNTYTGNTTVSTGTLAGTSANAFGSGSIGIAGSGTLSLRGDSDTSFVKASDSSAYTIQTSASGATINADQATGGGTAAKTMTIGSLGTSSTAATYQVNFTGANNTSLSLGAVTGPSSTAGGNVTLSNSISGGGGLTLASYTSTAASGSETLIFSGNGNTTVTGAITPSATQSLSLTKSGTGTLTLSSNSTYTGSTTISAGTVAFNTNSALGTGAVTLGGALSALATATLSNNISVASAGTLRVGSGNTFTSSGVISGAGAVTKNSGGTLDLSSANTNSFSGGMKINDGTVVVTAIGNAGANSALGTGATIQLGAGTSAGTLRWDGVADEITNKVIDFAATTNSTSGATLTANAVGRTLTFTSNTTVSGSGNKTLTLGGSGNIAFAGVVSNGANATVSLTKSGAGTASLGAANTYTGNTLVSAGTLLVNGSTSASSAVTVNAAATLGGSGTINGATIVNGTLNPGIATTLTLGSNLTLGSGSNLTLTLGTSSSKIAFVSATNNLLGSGNATLNLSQGAGFDYGTTYRIFENTSTAGYAFNAITGYDDAGYTANFAQSGLNYDLSFTAVPEPSAYALLLAGLATLIFARRRKSA